jgi:gluconokinase
MKTAISSINSSQLIGVCFSSAMHGLIAVDKNCKPLTDMLTWADLRSKDYANRLKNTEQGKKIYERTGTPIHPMSPLFKLMWLKDNEPAIFNTAHNSVASATGLFDIYDLKWNDEALHIAGISTDRLSMPVPVTHILKDKAGVPFIIGGSDGCLAHIGSNALNNGDVSLTIGTSGAVRIMTTAPVKDSLQRVFNYILTDGLYISGGPVNNGGNLLQWFTVNFLKKPFAAPAHFEEFIEEALSVPAGSDDLIFLPYIYAERAPVWDADAKGMFFGITSTHTVAHFMRAIMEGISFGLLSVLQTLEDVTGNVGSIYVSGGFVKSEKWVLLLADVLGKTLHVTQAQDSSAAGAAMIGMKALGIIDSFDETSFFRVDRSFEPNLRNHGIHKKNYAVYSVLYDKLKDIKK